MLGHPVSEHVQDAVGGCSANHKFLVSVSLVRGEAWHTGDRGEKVVRIRHPDLGELGEGGGALGGG